MLEEMCLAKMFVDHERSIERPVDWKRVDLMFSRILRLISVHKSLD